MRSNIFTTNLHDAFVISHTNEVSETKEGIFLVMDYVESDMRKVLESVRHGTVLQEDHVVTILYNILCSVKFLHAANVMHRDLKPGNLLINSQCGVKIADYGLSRSIPVAVEESTISIKN